MSDNNKYFGSDVGRHLNVGERGFTDVLYQPHHPPISEEFNLQEDISKEERKKIIQTNTPSGFLTDPLHHRDDFQTDRKASNLFWMGSNESGGDEDIVWAMVNGWTVPVAGTHSSDPRNKIKLPPPPGSSSSSDVNFVFLEVWQVPVKPSGTTYKPSKDRVYRWGNVDYGGTNPKHQIQDPRAGQETSERIQTQYRIRVVNDHDPHAHPLGFNDSITAQGPLSSPLSTSNNAYTFTNMGETMGDPGLWRAGIKNSISDDGTNLLTQSELKTLDGFVWAIPVCFIFRRAQGNFSHTKQNSAANRFSSASSASDAKVLNTIKLDQDIAHDLTSTFDVDVNVSSTEYDGSGGKIQIDEEIIEYSDWSGTTITVNNRGHRDTQPSFHDSGSEVRHVSGHPEGLFSDQIAREDIYDLRHAVSLGGFDHQSMLEANFEQLIRGDLKTQWKSGKGGTKGTKHWQVDYFHKQSASGSLSNNVEERDEPDGLRRVFSDAAAPQPHNIAVFPDGQQTPSLSSTEYDFNPSGSAVKSTGGGRWKRGDVLEIPLDQFRTTFSGDHKVRFVHPSEYTDTNHDPLTMWFGETEPSNSATDYGSDSPINARRDSNDEARMVVLGENPGTVAGSYLSNTGDTLEFDWNGSPQNVSSIKVPNVTYGDTPSSINGQEVGEWLAGKDAWIVIKEPNVSDKVYHGAYKIKGTAGSNTPYNGVGLEVVRPEDLQGQDQFGSQQPESDIDWKIRLPSCTEDDDNLIVCMAKGFQDAAGQATDDWFSERAAYLDFTTLYHPNQGLSRAPEEGWEVWMQKNSGTGVSYLKETELQNRAGGSGTMYRFPLRPLDTYPHDPTTFHTRDPRDAEKSREQTWSEAYVDPGSKTFVFQPTQDITLHQVEQNLDSDASFKGSQPNLESTPYNFNLSSGDPAFSIKHEFLPPAGRIDAPVVNSEPQDGPPFGINTTFVASSDSSDQTDTVVKNRHLLLYDPVNSPTYNTSDQLDNISSDPNAPSDEVLVCRFYDKGGVRGIELPPQLGISRLFSVYALQDYIDHGSEFQPGANSEWRQRKNNYNGVNALKMYDDRRSLIVTDSDTWVIPEEAINMREISGKLKDAQLVFEFAPFVFEGWTSGSHTRIFTHQNPSGNSLRMLANGPADRDEEAYVISRRTPYQGNVNGTMPASTSGSGNFDWGDYEYKADADSASEINDIGQDLDIDKARMPNPARLKVQATLPFATSLGTGRIGGEFHPGSITDVGYADPSDFPDNVSSRRAVKSRALFEKHSQAKKSGGSYDRSRVSSKMIGLTERLPLGLYGADHQLVGEGFYGDQHRLWKSVGASQENLFDVHPHDNMSQGQAQNGASWIFSDGTGAPKYSNSNDLYRTYRGGVVSQVTDEDTAQPVLATGGKAYKEYPFLKDIETEFLEEMESTGFGAGSNQRTSIKQRLRKKFRQRLQVHGAVVFGIAALIRTQRETVTSNDVLANEGGELQMVVLTGLSFGKDASLDLLESGTEDRERLQLQLQLSPVGTGEGYCAADRFRLKGKPLETANRSDEEANNVSLYRFRD